MVSNVIDGDTLRLTDGRLLRFVGINTPEIDHQGGASEPFAREARQALRQLLAGQKRIKLVYGPQRRDRHGRTLAHIFGVDGENIQATLLSMGLAYWIVVPPNLGFRDCYRAAEQAARQQRRNLWDGSSAILIHVDEKGESGAAVKKGFALLEGKVRRISPGRHAVNLYLSERMVVRVSDKYRANFPDGLQRYLHHNIQVRGWMYPRKGGWQMYLKHPDSVQVDP